MNRLSLVALALLASTGCSPALGGLSGAAPGLTLKHEHVAFGDDVVTLSEGTAYALDCWTLDGPCDSVRAVSSDPKIAEVLPSHLERRMDWYGELRAAPAKPGFVIAAMSPGETTISFQDGGAETRIRVVVE
ncbi:MAG: hypothetical protein JNL21_04380 [Myxococcales bacterium]|nr:hypothetical protein [Myxococcales bacterium]